MDNRKIYNMLVADLFCLRATTEPDMMLFCDNNCDSCKWLYQKGTNGERKEMLKILIELIETEMINEIRNENKYDIGYQDALDDLINELDIEHYEDTDGIKVKYIRDAMARILRNEV